MKKRQKNPYPLNILIEASEACMHPFLSADDISALSNNPTLLPIFEYLIAVYMKPQMQKVVRYYYSDFLTVVQIGERMQITESRVRKIKDDAIRFLLHHSEWFNMLMMGFPAYFEERCRKSYKEGYEEGRKNGERDAYQRGYDDCQNNRDSQHPRKAEELPNTPVEELGLSVRAHNCMKRSGINTLQEIAGLEPEELASIKNLGVKSYNEIVEMLKTYGADTAKYHEDE